MGLVSLSPVGQNGALQRMKVESEENCWDFGVPTPLAQWIFLVPVKGGR